MAPGRKIIQRERGSLKIKTTVVFFNVVVIVFLAGLFLVPFAVLDSGMAALFWQSIRWVLPVLAVLLAAIDGYFFFNFRVFRLLEKEDWPALALELEKRVPGRGVFSGRFVKLLANCYILLADTQAVSALEKKLAEIKPKLINANALVFGASRVLSGDTAGALAFFMERTAGNAPGVPSGDREWLSWYYGFALLLNRQFAPASERFSLLARESKDGVIAGLSAYFLEDSLNKALPGRNLAETARVAKDRVRSVLKRRADWDREIRRFETELHAVILTTYIKKTAGYIYT